MTKRLLLAVLLCALTVLSVPTQADRYRRGASDNPFRLVSYVVYPVGLLAEYVVFRPVHWVVSQPTLDVVFGHKPTPEMEEGTYFEWTHGDFTPSISEEREAAPRAAAVKSPKAEAKKAEPKKAEVKKEVKKAENKAKEAKKEAKKDEAKPAAK